MESGDAVTYADDVTMRGKILDAVVYESHSYRVEWEDGDTDWYEEIQVMPDDQRAVSDPLTTIAV